MSHVIKNVDEFVNEIVNASYSQEWPMNKQEIGVTADDMADTEYYKHENKFQEVQEHMKAILKPILLKKNPNASEQDIEKVSDSFFRLGNEKNTEVKKMVDGCKDTKQCAQDIVNKYYKYVKINFGTKDNINDVEQNSVMSSESVKDNFGEVCEYCDGTGRDPNGKGRCRFCKGTGFTKSKKISKKKMVENFNEFITEGKRQQRKTNITDVESIPGGIKYHNEIFPGLNVPKRYVGKGDYRWRVLAAENGKVKPINFGDKKEVLAPVSRLKKKYWDNIPTYKY